jgi:hypothetical protein
MRDAIPAAIDFIEEHILDIILVVLLLFVMVIYIVLNNIKFPKSHPKLQSMEEDKEKTTSNKISEIESGVEEKAEKKNICEGSLLDKDKACGSLLDKDSCGSVDCCVWAKKNKSKSFSCVGGDMGGPTYDSHKYDEYYYENKRYGKETDKLQSN